jgi:hypothetical protein
MRRNIKGKLKTLIEEINDEGLLEAVYRILEERNKLAHQELGKKIMGSPMTIDEYNQDVLKAIERIEKGKYVTHEEAVKRLRKYE